MIGGIFKPVLTLQLQYFASRTTIGSNSLKLSEFTEAFVVATDHPLVNPSSSSLR